MEKHWELNLELYWEQVGGAKSLNSKYLQVPSTLTRRTVQLIKAHLLVGCLQNLSPFFFFSSFFFPSFFLFFFLQKIDQ
jgi:hypothetical protein